MFLQNVGYRFPTMPLKGDGLVLLPSGNFSERMSRLSLAEKTAIFLDPQLYLAELDSERNLKVCSRLASYQWLGSSDVPQFDASTARPAWQKDLEDNIAEYWPGNVGDDIVNICQRCIEFQLAVGCTHVILPAPLLREREDEAATLADWLDAGLNVAKDLDLAQPLIASIPVDESALNDQAFSETGYLNTIADQVISREGHLGVYIVVAQTQVAHSFDSRQIVYRAYDHLVTAFSGHGLEYVLVNFADLFGFISLGLGASGFATGSSHALRRLALDGFRDTGGGHALPHLYSHRIMGELLSEHDLDAIVGRKLLARVRDETSQSRDLMSVLRRGGSAKQVPAWAESRNNITASKEHYLERLWLESKSLRSMTVEQRREELRDQLETAAANGLLISKRLAVPPSGNMAPVEDWLDLLNAHT